jgi:PAS domain S-box-containing protein
MGSASWRLRYGVACSTTLLALSLALLLRPYIGLRPLLLAFAAVGISAWYGGLGPGLLATFLSVLGSLLVFPSGTSPDAGVLPDPQVRMVLFVAVAALISGLTAALRESEQRFRATFDQAPIGIAHVGTDGQWLRVNRKLCDIVGYTREELRSRTFQEITHPDDLELDLENVRRVLAGEIRTFSREKRYVRKDGSLVWAHLTVSLVREPAGGPKYFISTVEEIGERKRLEEALRQRAEALAEADRRKDEFLAMLAHELRNPLAPILNAVALIRPDQSDARRQAWGREVLERQARHMARLLDDLLDVSRITRGKISLRRERLDLGRLVRESVEDYRGTVDAASLTLTLELPEEPVWVDGDATRLAQVVGNLLQNATRFSDPGGQVTVRLVVDDAGKQLTTETGEPRLGRAADSERGGGRPSSRAPGRHGEKRTEKDDLEVEHSPFQTSSSVYSSVSPCLRGEKAAGDEKTLAVITVSDTGIGIAPEMLPCLFEPLTQADRTLDRSRGGLGLGLALVKGLVELHGGEVDAESDGPGQGAAFTVRLPRQQSVAKAPAAAGPPRATNGGNGAARGRRVLVVEDNHDVAETVRDLLRLNGHEVELADTGPAGVAAARRFRPEVVLCDIGLPGCDGYAVARALRQDPVTASARLIAISGYGQEEDERRSHEAGFERHLTKPVHPADLQHLLAEN